MLAIVAIIAAMDDMLVPMLMISGTVRPRRNFLVGTTIWQPGSGLFFLLARATMPFM